MKYSELIFTFKQQGTLFLLDNEKTCSSLLLLFYGHGRAVLCPFYTELEYVFFNLKNLDYLWYKFRLGATSKQECTRNDLYSFTGRLSHGRWATWRLFVWLCNRLQKEKKWRIKTWTSEAIVFTIWEINSKEFSTAHSLYLEVRYLFENSFFNPIVM